MVDVGGKAVTDRRAVARAVVRMSPATAAPSSTATRPRATCSGPRGSPGIQAAKRTAELIPLCHPLAAVVRRTWRPTVDADAGA